MFKELMVCIADGCSCTVRATTGDCSVQVAAFLNAPVEGWIRQMWDVVIDCALPKGDAHTPAVARLSHDDWKCILATTLTPHVPRLQEMRHLLPDILRCVMADMRDRHDSRGISIASILKDAPHQLHAHAVAAFSQECGDNGMYIRMSDDGVSDNSTLARLCELAPQLGNFCCYLDWDMSYPTSVHAPAKRVAEVCTAFQKHGKRFHVAVLAIGLCGHDPEVAEREFVAAVAQLGDRLHGTEMRVSCHAGRHTALATRLFAHVKPGCVTVYAGEERFDDYGLVYGIADPKSDHSIRTSSESRMTSLQLFEPLSSDEVGPVLAQLANAQQLQTLSLALPPSALAQLIALLAHMPELAQLRLLCDMAVDSDCEALAAMLPQLPMLASFDASNCNMTAAGFAAISRALGSCASLTELDLSSNAARLDGARALAGSLRTLQNMRVVRASECSFTVAGVVAVAHALHLSGALLQECDLRDNYSAALVSAPASLEAFSTMLVTPAPWRLLKLRVAGMLAPQLSAAQCGLAQALREQRLQELRELKLCDTQLVSRSVDAQAAAQCWEHLLGAALSLPALEELDLSNTGLTHAAVCAAIALLNAAPALEGFVIAHNALPDASLHTLIVDWAGTEEHYKQIRSSAKFRRIAAHKKRGLRNSLPGNHFSMPSAGLRPSVFNPVAEDQATGLRLENDACFTHSGKELSQQELMGIEAFTAADIVHDDVQRVSLHRHRLSGASAYTLEFFSFTGVRQLHLTSCSIDDAGMTYLAFALPSTCNLIHLDLTSNALSHAGVRTLVTALVEVHADRAAPLHVLRLVGNQIHTRGAQWLAYLYHETQQPQQPSVTEHDVGPTGWQVLVPVHAAMLGDVQLLEQ